MSRMPMNQPGSEAAAGGDGGAEEASGIWPKRRNTELPSVVAMPLPRFTPPEAPVYE